MDTIDFDVFAPVSPGEILRDEFLAEYGLSDEELAAGLGVSVTRIADIVEGRQAITADDALRFGLLFGNSPEFWMNLQTRHDLKKARRALLPEEAARIARLRAA